MLSGKRQYQLFKVLSKVVCLVPYGMVLRLGNQVGNLYWRLAKKQRLRAEAQMKESLGYSAAQAEQTVREVFRHLGKMVLETLYMPRLTKPFVEQHVVIENQQYMDEAMAAGRGVVILTAHLGNWEWIGPVLCKHGYPIAGIAKRQPNDYHTQLLNEFREQSGMEIYSRGTTELVSAAKALRSGKALGFLADQDAGVHGLFVPFLGKMASTPMGPAVFSSKFGSPVVPMFIIREEWGHRLLLLPPLKVPEQGDKEEIIWSMTVEMTEIVEKMVRQYPHLWLWFQKRWNTPYTQEREAEE